LAALFWENRIRNETDFAQPIEYIYYNPVKYGLVAAPEDQPDSRFHKYIQRGIYLKDLGADQTIIFDPKVGNN
jgi:putative transposase